MAGGRSARHLRRDPVALRKPLERRIARLQLPLLGFRQPGALVVEDAHSERGGAQRDLAPDLAEPDDAQGRIVEHAQPGDASPIGVGGGAAVERLVDIALGGECFGTDAPGQAMHLLGERQHQRDGNLRAGDIGAPAEGQHLDAARRTGRGVDIAGHDPVFLYRNKIGADGELGRPDRQRFDDQAAGAGQVGVQVLGCVNEPHPAREQRTDAPAHARAIAVKIRIVMGEEVGVGGARSGEVVGSSTTPTRRRKGIIFDDEGRSLAVDTGQLGLSEEGQASIATITVDLKRFRHRGGAH